MTPLITVLMPVLNAEAYLGEALDSLAEQTLRDFKVLVLDGGSVDRTPELARAYHRIPLDLVFCGRIGLGAQLRMGLHQVHSPYVARMDADDLSLAMRFEKQISAFESIPELVIVGSQIELLIGSKVCRAAVLPQQHAHIRKALCAGFPAFCNPSVMYRTEVALRCSSDAVSGLGEDLDLFLRMTEAGAGRNLSEVLHRYRLHTGSTTFRSFEELRKDYKYALECARARRAGRQEPSAGQYAAKSGRRSGMQRLAARLECLGVTMYRRSRIRMAEGNWLIGILGVLLSVLLRPRLVRVRGKIQLSAWWQAITSL